MRGESMKGKSKKSTYSTTFGVDPNKFLSLQYRRQVVLRSGGCSLVAEYLQKIISKKNEAKHFKSRSILLELYTIQFINLFSFTP